MKKVLPNKKLPKVAKVKKPKVVHVKPISFNAKFHKGELKVKASLTWSKLTVDKKIVNLKAIIDSLNGQLSTLESKANVKNNKSC